MTTFIYLLKEPDTGEIRYVGKANDPKERLRKHLTEAKTQRASYKNNWLRSLSSEPLLEVIDEVPFEHWQQLEVAYIEFFREQGCRLVNTTVGGESFGSGEDHPNFGMPAWNRGKKATEETRKKQSLARQGKPAWNRGKTCEYLSITQLGEKNHNFGKPAWNRGTKTGKPSWNRGKTMSLEQRAKISAAKLGASPSLETRLKISMAMKKYCLQKESRGGLLLG